MILIIPAIFAIQINQTTLYSTGSGTNITIYDPINITNITITNTNITLFNMSRTSDIYNVSSANVIHPITDNQQLNITLAGNITYYIWKNDTTAPNITLMSPSNSSSFSTDTITFIANVSDRNTVVNCSLWIEQSNGFMIRATNSSPANGQNNSFTRAGLENGYHYWMVQCIDNWNNTRNSSIFNITLTLGSGGPLESAGGGGGDLDTPKSLDERCKALGGVLIGNISCIFPTGNGTLYDIIVNVGKNVYTQDDTIQVDIQLYNYGLEIDRDILLHYYLISPNNKIYSESMKTIKEVSLCSRNFLTGLCHKPSLKLSEEFSLPANAEIGRWTVVIEKDGTRSFDTFEVVLSRKKDVFVSKELLMHIQASLLQKLFPNYKENIPNNNICELGESPFIGSGKLDCAFNWRTFTNEGIQYYAWISRFLVILIVTVAIVPVFFKRNRI